MGNNIIAQDNISESNQQDGFHFMGYDTVLDVSNNTLRGNSGAGLGFQDDLFGSNGLISPLNFDANGESIQPGGIHHNFIINNQSHSFPDELGNTFARCGIATILDNGTTIEMADNIWGNDQRICDLSGSTVVLR